MLEAVRPLVVVKWRSFKSYSSDFGIGGLSFSNHNDGAVLVSHLRCLLFRRGRVIRAISVRVDSHPPLPGVVVVAAISLACVVRPDAFSRSSGQVDLLLATESPTLCVPSRKGRPSGWKKKSFETAEVASSCLS